MKKLNHYNFYGSADSIDKDVVMFFNPGELPDVEEERKHFVQDMKKQYPEFNLMLAVVKDGLIIDCLTPTSPDNLNNSVFTTYNNFEQVYPCPVVKLIDRNLTMAYYNTIHFLMTFLSRTNYRPVVRPIINYQNKFLDKINVLINQIELSTIFTFNQKNTSDVDIWKKFAFYLVQQTAIQEGIEIYSKQDARNYEKKSIPFIDREELKMHDLLWIDVYFKKLCIYLSTLPFEQNGEILTLNNQSANMRFFKAIKP